MRTAIPRGWSPALIGLIIWLGLAQNLFAQPRQSAQMTYASPEAAVSALVAAARAHDQAALRSIFGPHSERLLSSGDPYADAQQLDRFVAAYDEKHVLTALGPGHMQLIVGSNEWPLPMPIVDSGGHWQFATQAGAAEIIDRRIGRNEFAAIRVLLAYVDAQRDYFARMRRETGTAFYAERMLSAPGRQDGLYWPTSAGEPESPLGPLVSAAIEEGYPGQTVNGQPVPYQGYYFRILKAQGPNAPEGAKDYVQSGRMTGGFALIAWPARYGASGITSFEVSQDDVVFQKDLGPDTGQIAATITRFDPDLTWARVDVTEH